MKNTIATCLLAGMTWLALLTPRLLVAQSCQDEQAMLEDSTKTLADFVDTVKKESLEQFQNKFHQKSGFSKLTFTISMLDQMVSCLDKASQDPAAPKDQVEAYKAKKEGYTKLMQKLDGERQALKAAEAPKDAKALIEKLSLN